MTCKIITIINQKGGVGKSIITVNLSYGLYLKSNKVLTIDLDPQAHSSCVFCPEILTANQTISEAFTNKKTNIHNLIKTAKINNLEIDKLDIIPSNIKLATAIEQINSTIYYKEKILKNHLNALKTNYDYIIMDCPPTLGLLAVNAIYCADTIIIPINFNKDSLDGMVDLLTAIKEIKEEQTHKIFVLKNLFEQKNGQINKYINEQLKGLDDNLFTAIIRKNRAINQAQIANLPIQIFNRASKGAQDFSLLVDEVTCYA